MNGTNLYHELAHLNPGAQDIGISLPSHQSSLRWLSSSIPWHMLELYTNLHLALDAFQGGIPIRGSGGMKGREVDVEGLVIFKCVCNESG